MARATAISSLTDSVREAAIPLAGSAQEYDPLMDLVGDARFVLIGEASHGTHEFYQQRAAITMRLITEKGFAGVAVEADWPDAYRVNRYVLGASSDPTPNEALSDFRRFPAWMWRNKDVLEFVGWLREYNDSAVGSRRKAGFYGLDLYSLFSSIEEVVGYLDRVDPEAARRARARYACFDHFGRETDAYGYAAGLGIAEPCEQEVVSQLVELQKKATEYAGRPGRVAEDEYFYAEQNARLAKNAEEYYRSIYRGRVPSWNLRDRHMAETLNALVAHLDREDGRAKVVVWAHNSHLGDARATEMGEAGELNVGQLVREQHGSDALLVGFSSFEGTVTAASDWSGPAERKRVRPALPGSYEELFHDTGNPRFMLDLKEGSRAVEGLRRRRLERAIGVIYRPETERIRHYFSADLPAQFDVMLHFDYTHAVEPLERTSQWEAEEAPETFPFGV